VRCATEEARKADKRSYGAREFVGEDAAKAKAEHALRGYLSSRTKHFAWLAQGESKVSPDPAVEKGTNRETVLAGIAA
jgi:hypothetical protein